MKNMKEFDERIKENPYYTSWTNSYGGFKDSINDDGVINYEGLSDEDKLRLYVYAWNKAGYLPRKSSVIKKFGWTEKQFKAVYTLAGNIRTQPTFSEDTGLINGRGYSFEF
jgi:hypothetical protein